MRHCHSDIVGEPTIVSREICHVLNLNPTSSDRCIIVYHSDGTWPFCQVGSAVAR